MVSHPAPLALPFVEAQCCFVRWEAVRRNSPGSVVLVLVLVEVAVAMALVVAAVVVAVVAIGATVVVALSPRNQLLDEN